MVGLSGLWMPILLAGVLVFFMSSIIHMALGWHNSENPAPPQQDALADAIRPFNIPPGDYMMPRAGSMKEMGEPAYLEKVKKGPVIFMTVRPNEMNFMGKQLGLWFVYCLVVSVFTAYVTGRALGQGAEYMAVFRIAGTVAFASYVLALWQGWIWWGKSLRYMLTSSADGLIYALLTAGAFGWLWPR